jgi:hypothetical protein
MRKLTLESGVWEFQVGSSNLSVRSPQGKRTTVDFSKLTGLSWEQIENLQDNKGFAVSPGDVRKFIEEVVIPGEKQ